MSVISQKKFAYKLTKLKAALENHPQSPILLNGERSSI